MNPTAAASMPVKKETARPELPTHSAKKVNALPSLPASLNAQVVGGAGLLEYVF